jgi:hypothetical protein
MPAQTNTAELAELRAELTTPAASPPAAATPAEPAPAEPPPTVPSESQLQLEHFLKEVQSALTEAADATEDLVAEHPLPAISAAFLLGLGVGWLAARG